MLGQRNICFQNQRRQSVKKQTAGTKSDREYDKVYRQVECSGNTVEWTTANLLEQLQLNSALGQLYSLKWKFQGDLNLKTFYQKSIDTVVEKGFVMILVASKEKCSLEKEWYLPHYPVLNPDKSGKFICNSASKYKAVCLVDKLLVGPALLHGLIGTLFRFCERPLALRADIESVLRQVQFPEKDRLCLGFLWHPRNIEPRSNTRISVSRIRRQNFPTCASYAIKRLGIDKEELYPMAAKARQINFYMDNFIKSVGTSGEAIDIFSCKIFFRSFALNWKSE